MSHVLWSVCLAVLVAPVDCADANAKNAELIANRLVVQIRMGPRNHVMGGCAQWRHLANTTERFVFSAIRAFAKLLWALVYVLY